MIRTDICTEKKMVKFTVMTTCSFHPLTSSLWDTSARRKTLTHLCTLIQQQFLKRKMIHEGQTQFLNHKKLVILFSMHCPRLGALVALPFAISLVGSARAGTGWDSLWELVVEDKPSEFICDN